MAIISRAISGPYKWALGPRGAALNSLGVIEDAVTARFVTSEEEVVGDNLGDAIQAMVNRGHNAYLDFVFQEAELQAVQEIMWPYVSYALRGSNVVLPGQFGHSVAGGAQSVGQVRGNRTSAGTDVGCFQLVGAAVVGGTFPDATSTTPTVIRADRCTLAPNQSLDQLYGSRHRPVALSILCMPFVDRNPAGVAVGPTYSIAGIPIQT